MKILKSVKWYVVLSLIVITTVAAVPLSAHTITYDDVSYDWQNSRTTFTYTVTSSGGQGGGLSHWVYEWCEEAHIFDTNPDYTEYGNDPTTGYAGMKWELNDWEEGDNQTYYITFTGIWPVDPNGARIAFKDGNGNTFTTVAGPACITSLGELGDYVWVDSDMDGIQDSGESGKSGVLVEKNVFACEQGAGITYGKISASLLGQAAFKTRTLSRYENTRQAKKFLYRAIHPGFVNPV